MMLRSCSFCPTTYRGDAPFCTSCERRIREGAAAAEERQARVMRGDLNLFIDSEPLTDYERDAINRVRRSGNFTGIST